MTNITENFNAIVAEEVGDRIEYAPQIVTADQLPDGEVTIKVEYSTVNYKDMLAVTPGSKVVQNYPIIPGIDIAGTVAASTDPLFQVGQRVVAHGFDIGTGRNGGFAEYARVPAKCVVPIDSISTHDAMSIGTAGFTAALSVLALIEGGITPERGQILVTGASGGVGSISIDILSKLGYEVVASSGTPSAEPLLLKLGASEIVGRLPEDPDARIRPLSKATWAGAIDTVGGKTLAHALSTLEHSGVVAASGNAGGLALPTTVMPFILRGVTLRGIDSVQLPIDQRREVWNRLSDDLAPRHLSEITSLHNISEVRSAIEAVAAGTHIGRAVLRVAGGFE